MDDPADKFVSLKYVEDSHVKATAYSQPTEVSTKIPPDLTDEKSTPAVYALFNEPQTVPSIQVMDGLPVHRADYHFLSDSFVCDYSEPDPYYLPDKSSLQPDQLQFPGEVNDGRVARAGISVT